MEQLQQIAAYGPRINRLPLSRAKFLRNTCNANLAAVGCAQRRIKGSENTGRHEIYHVESGKVVGRMGAYECSLWIEANYVA